MSTIAVPVSSRRFRIRSRIWAWIVTSSAVVGSSAMSSSGSQARAIAIITRWAMPPDISCGKFLSRRAGSGMPTIFRSSSARECASLPFIPRWMRSTSSIWRPTSHTGFSDEVGCWKIMLIRSPRILRISSFESLSRSWPSNRISPPSIRPGLAMSRMIDRLVTLLPQPDSPTRPMISPRSTWKSMPSTARTIPSRVKKDVRRPFTSSSGFSPRSRRRLRSDAGRISSMTVSSRETPRLSGSVVVVSSVIG